jgi:hypothetical protein
MGPFFLSLGLGGLENSPYKMSQQCEKQQHEYSANPDKEVQCHFGVIDLFLVHGSS